MSDRNQIMWGEGIAFVDGIEAFDIQELAFNFDIEVLEALKGDAGGNIRIPTGQPISGRIGFLGMNAPLFNKLTGAATVAGTIKRKRAEILTKSSDQLTLSESTAISTAMRIVPVSSNAQPLTRVDSGPTVGQYSVSGATVTLNSSQAETQFECSYMYTDSGSGERSRFSPNSLPDSFEIYGSLRTKELFSNVKDDLIVYAAKCERVSDFGLGSQIGAISTPGFDFSSRVDASGDFDVCWP